MFYPIAHPVPSAWLPNFSQWLRKWRTALTSPPATQIQIQPGDAYHLAAGGFCVRVLAGQVWAPTVGILDAGDQLTLTVDATGLVIHSYAQQPAVLAVRNA